jgi:hypothetical protein
MSETKKIQKAVKPANGTLSGKNTYIDPIHDNFIIENTDEESISKKDYLSNKELFAQIIESKGKGALTHKAQKMLYTLGNNVIKKKRYYYNPDDRKDCLQTGLLDMYSNWKNFDPAKSTNAFAYFTEVFKRGMARGFNQLNKKKGDPNNESRTISINSSNDGEGIFNL